MAKFSYSEYEALSSKPKANKTFDSTNSQKVGFFKLQPGGEALVRINLSSIDQLEFAAVHHPAFGAKWEGLSNPFAGISCVNEVGNYSDNCPLCKAFTEGSAIVGKAVKRVYVKMLVSYKDVTTGTFSAPQPVVWERPAGFSKELATKLNNYGDLTQVLLLITRTGDGTDTKYSLDYAVPAVYKPDMIPADFSAFDGLKLNKHSYYEIPVEDIETYIKTGSFPEKVKVAETPAPVKETPAPAPAPAPVTPKVEETPTPVAETLKPAPTTTGTKFGGFSF